jgi:hypothetical protein
VRNFFERSSTIHQLEGSAREWLREDGWYKRALRAPKGINGVTFIGRITIPPEQLHDPFLRILWDDKAKAVSDVEI